MDADCLGDIPAGPADPETRAICTVSRSSTRRGRTLGLVAVAIVLVGTIGTVATAGLSAPPAGAAAASVTYQANVTQPGPLATNFAQTTGGDGWAVALTSTQVFNVSHHQPTLNIACHNQSNAAQCWSTPTKTVTNGSNSFATPSAAGLYLNQSTGKLYTYATELPSHTAGVVCIDTTQPPSATGAQLFCGFTPLSGVGDAPTTFHLRDLLLGECTGSGRHELVQLQRSPGYRRRYGSQRHREHTDVLQPHHLCGMPCPTVRGSPRRADIGSFFATPPTAADRPTGVHPLAGDRGIHGDIRDGVLRCRRCQALVPVRGRSASRRSPVHRSRSSMGRAPQPVSAFRCPAIRVTR